MKRTISALAVTAGAVATALTGIGPASASAIDCSAGGYTWVRDGRLPTDHQAVAVDGRSYNFSLDSSAPTFEVCLDIPDTSTFTVEVRIWSIDTGAYSVYVNDQPGDKVFHFSPGARSFWQVYGTMTGPGSDPLPYSWHEKRIST